MGESVLKQILEEIKSRGEVSTQLELNRPKKITTLEDAKTLCEIISTVATSGCKHILTTLGSPLMTFVHILLDTENKSCVDYFKKEGLPILRGILQQNQSKERMEDEGFITILHVLVKYRDPDDAKTVAQWICKPLKENSPFSKGPVFNAFDKKHPGLKIFVEILSNPFRDVYSALKILEMANCGKIDHKKHPFNNEQGIKILTNWLSSKQSAAEEFACEAVEATPFLKQEYREQLLNLAKKHKNKNVKLTCGHIMAKMKMKEGVEILQHFCTLPEFASIARMYLEWTGYKKLIPQNASDPDLEAQYQMIEWLEHPLEYGKRPYKIELFDKRKLYWPTEKKEIDVWLFKYTFKGKGGKPDETHIGMVGSWTFEYDKSKPDMTPEEVYGIHCCYELQHDDDKRAPKEVSALAGMKILAKYNKDFRIKTEQIS